MRPRRFPVDAHIFCCQIVHAQIEVVFVFRPDQSNDVFIENWLTTIWYVHVINLPKASLNCSFREVQLLTADECGPPT